VLSSSQNNRLESAFQEWSFGADLGSEEKLGEVGIGGEAGFTNKSLCEGNGRSGAGILTDMAPEMPERSVTFYRL